MLDPWIIEQIRKREDEERRHPQERPAVEMPEYRRPPHEQDGHDENDRQPPSERGVVIIDFGV
jgi:hypothetical protein